MGIFKCSFQKFHLNKVGPECELHQHTLTTVDVFELCAKCQITNEYPRSATHTAFLFSQDCLRTFNDNILSFGYQLRP